MDSTQEDRWPFVRQALARVRSQPPNPELDPPELDGWRVFVLRLAKTLDSHHRRGEAGRWGALIVRQAFDTFLPLADPAWWQVHPEVRVTGRQRRFLRQLRKQRRARTARAKELEQRLSQAFITYIRRGSQAGFERCQRLCDVILEAPVDPEEEAHGRLNSRAS